MKRLFTTIATLLVALGSLRAADSIVITEFMAANDTTLKDEDGQFSDWIELYNNGDGPVNLAGWSLTDTADNPGRWIFPGVTLPPNSYLIVFASGKNRRVPGANLHANFSLSAGGEYLALVQPDGLTIASQFSPRFPDQFNDIAYGVGMTGPTLGLLAEGAPARALVPTGPLPTNWLHRGFNDSAWPSGTTGAGYDLTTNYAAAIGLNLGAAMSNRNASALLRVPFVVPDVTAFKELLLRLRYDDGFVAYVNGTEVLRRNAPAAVAWDSAATASHGPPAPGALAENFEGPAAPYALAVYGAGSAPAVQPAAAGTSGKFLRLLYDGVNSAFNSVAFPQTAPGLFDSIVSEFDFRVFNAANNPADGLAFMLIPTATYGTSGNGVPVGGIGVEEPNFPGVFAVGFDVYPRTEPRNDVSVHWNGAEYSNVTMADANLNITAGVFHRARVTLRHVPGGARVTVTLTPNILGTPGVPFTPINDLFIAGLNAFESRVQFAARTGGLNMQVDVDNVNVQFIPPAALIAAEEFNISVARPLLVNGTNLLALHGLNVAATDRDFLISPALYTRNISLGTVPGFLATPTPGSANSAVLDSPLAPVTFSPPGGIFSSNTVTVRLATTSSSAGIRYTLDGSTPTASSLLYTGAVVLSQNTALRARAYQPGRIDSPVSGGSYFFIDNSLAEFSSRLPLVVVDSLNQVIPQDNRVSGYACFIDTNSTASGRVSLTTPPRHTSRLGIEVRGSSSAGFPKQSYGIELNNEAGGDAGQPLFGLPSHSDWVLYAPYTDKSFMNDVLAYDLHEAMGHYAVRRKFVELFVRTTPGRLGSNNYAGIYVLLEKVRRDNDRVDIASLDSGDNTAPAVTGGYLLKKDRLDANDLQFTTTSGQALGIVDPKAGDITPAQQAYIRDYVNAFEAALYGPSYRDPVNGYAAFIDVDSFVDQHWIVEFPKNIDGYRLSNYMNKDRNGKLAMEPIWDWNLSFGNANYLEGEFTAGWYWPLLSEVDHIWLRRLLTDPDFNQRLIDRWAVLRAGALSTNAVLGRIANYARLLDEAQLRDFARWPRLGTYIWPNPTMYTTPTTFGGILGALTNYVVGRGAWIDRQYPVAPVLSVPGGPVSPGQVVTISAPAGTIWYTLDGTDPRLPGGMVNPAAQVYSAPIVLSANAGVFARVLQTNAWSGPASAPYVVAAPPLRISELMYHPVEPPAGSPWTADDFEFIEIMNIGPTPYDLRGVRLAAGVEFSFPSGELSPLGSMTGNSFDGGGTAYTASALSGTPGATVTAGGPAGSFLRLVNSGAVTNRNRVAFNQTAAGAADRVVADLDVRTALAGTVTGTGTPLGEDFSGAAAYTLSTFGGSGPAIQAADAGSSGPFCRIVPQVNGSLGAIAFNRSATGAFNTVIGQLDFRITPPAGAAPADGMGILLLNTAGFGPTGAAPQIGEEPGAAGSLGIGVDCYANAATAAEPNGNHISLHWNGTQIGNAVTPDFNLSNGRFHRLQFIMRHAGSTAFVTVRLTPDIQGTPGATVTLFQDVAIANAPAYESRLAVGARTGGLNASHDIDNVNLRYLNATAAPAAWSMAFLPSVSFGETGVGSTLATYTNQPAGSNLLALEFTGHSLGLNNEAAVYWNRALVAAVSLPTNVIHLADGRFHHARAEFNRTLGGLTLSLVLTPDSLGTPGAPVTVFSNLFVSGATLPASRVELAGRSAGVTTTIDADNLGVASFAAGPNLLAPGEAVVIVHNRAAFESLYGTGRRIAGVFTGRLDDGGERLLLLGPVGETILDFTYQDSWQNLSDGSGFSLVAVDSTLPPDRWGTNTAWRVSAESGGSPGSADPNPAVIPPILITEALATPAPPDRSFVELHNPHAVDVDVGGWYLSDDARQPWKHRIAPGTVVSAGGYLVLDDTRFNAVPGTTTNFALSAQGGELWLFSASPAGRLTGFAEGRRYGPSDPGISFGRHVNSEGTVEFVALKSRSPGAANPAPRVGPVVISEFMYHPPDIGLADNSLDEFVELQNISDEVVPLYDPARPQNPWILRDALDFDFPPGIALNPGERILVTGFDPDLDPEALAAFRSLYGVDGSVRIFGPWTGKLDNSRERVELKKPAPPVPGDIPHIVIDAVEYRDALPWPVSADGAGSSLQRRDTAAYGNEVRNWFAAGITAGGANYSNALPVVTLTSPADGTRVQRPAPVFLKATASDPDGTVVAVSFYANGVKLGESTVEPHAWTWTNAPYGVHQLQARARDNGGALNSSPVVTIEVRSTAPTVTLTTPTNGAVVPAGRPLTLNATAADTDGTVTRVDFVIDGVVAGSSTGPAFSFASPGLAPGLHRISAVALDDSGTPGTSAVHQVAFPALLVGNVSLVASNSMWKYWDLGTDPGTNWLSEAYDDSGWSNGIAQLGFGDNDEGTRVRNTNAQPGRIVTHYFRRQFTGTSLAGATNLLLRVQRDDGAVAYLNGVEVYRGNMPAGPVHFRTLAVAAMSGTDENFMFPTNLNPALLRPGLNTLAVEVHQQSTNNADLSFAADLVLNQSVFGPVFTGSPASRTNLPGTTTTFTPTVIGNGPLAFQWWFNNGPLAGATNLTLTLTNLQPAQAGAYRVVAVNPAGTATSDVATLTLRSADSDNDGLPDDWELANGTDPTVADATADPDLDGATNAGEWVAGTDPRDPASVLRITGFRLENGGAAAVLQFNAVAGKTYSVLMRPAAASAGAWERVADVGAEPVNRLVTLTNGPTAGGQQYYRLQTPRLP